MVADPHPRRAGGGRDRVRHGAGSTVTAPVVTVAVMTCGDAGLCGTLTRALPTLLLAWTA
jgi:hypothetical protein